jgi:hypothetical protein
LRSKLIFWPNPAAARCLLMLLIVLLSYPGWLHDSNRNLHRHCAADVLALPQQQLQPLIRTSALPTGNRPAG